jgi:pyruvate kinase
VESKVSQLNSFATERVLQRLLPELLALRNSAMQQEEAFAEEIGNVEPAYRDSARNLLHYLSVRQHDIRDLQMDLASLGLSSLGVLEPNVLASLNAVIGILERLTVQQHGVAPEPPVDFRTGPLLLRDHARSLLGPEPRNRSVRIMVTMPSEAASDARLVQDLLVAGMDVMRINCAHDGPEQWAAMVENLRHAERTVGRSCKVQADLAGPKLRTGHLLPAGHVLKIKPQRDIRGKVIAPGQVWLTPSGAEEPAPDNIRTAIPVDGEVLDALGSGDQLQISDPRGKPRALAIVGEAGQSRIGEASRGTYITAGARVEALRKGKSLAKGRIGSLPAVVLPITLFPADVLVLTREDEPGCDAVRDEQGKLVEPARIHCTLSAAFEHAKAGQSVWFDDGRIGGIVKDNDGKSIRVEITHTRPTGAKLRAEKGINFPDTDFDLPALTEKDRRDLEQVVEFVDMVALSFLRTAEDVNMLEDELSRLGAGHVGVVLKIENRQAFENLPRILLTSLRSPPVGVMVARGDLAVEIGFERLSEVQEEILWLCEAAHIPVIWATQMLEGLAKRGAPSRAEITDAAASSRAECAMLNKGPHIVETVHFLSGILSRMDTHLAKRKAMLRRLAVSDLR